MAGARRACGCIGYSGEARNSEAQRIANYLLSYNKHEARYGQYCLRSQAIPLRLDASASVIAIAGGIPCTS